MKSDIYLEKKSVVEVSGFDDDCHVSIVEWGNGEGMTVDIQDLSEGSIVDKNQRVDITFEQFRVLRAVLKEFNKAVDGD